MPVFLIVAFFLRIIVRKENTVARVFAPRVSLAIPYLMGYHAHLKERRCAFRRRRARFPSNPQPMTSNLNTTRIYVDADACPVKDEIYRVAARHGLPVSVVAGNFIRVPPDPLIERVAAGSGMDALFEAGEIGDQPLQSHSRPRAGGSGWRSLAARR